MSGKTTLILGGGLGGLTAAALLRSLAPPEHRIVVVEKKETFSLCMANLWLMNGDRQAPGEGERKMSGLESKRIEWVRGEVQAIQPETRTVQTSAGTLDGDYLIVALGAEKKPDAVPGFAEAALNLYDAEGAQRIKRALDEFSGGRIVVLISRTPFSCPAAPYEAAFLIDDVLRQRGLRDRTEIAVYTPEDLPMPVAGHEIGVALVSMLREHGIEFHGEQIVLKIDAADRRVLFEIDETSYDLLVGVPPHVAPALARDANLVDASGWIPVDPETLETRHPGVFAIGDVTAVRLANGMFLPKAGVFADGQAHTVAEKITADISGREAGRFDGRGFCYIEVGGGEAAYGSGNFFGLPGPRMTLEPPSKNFRKEKEGLERSALALLD
jgi:sulfide:quinone oxidoreductase